VEALQALDALVEWSSPSLFAVDARDQAHAQRLLTSFTSRSRVSA
jgi:hypothetical protein